MKGSLFCLIVVLAAAFSPSASHAQDVSEQVVTQLPITVVDSAASAVPGTTSDTGSAVPLVAAPTRNFVAGVAPVVSAESTAAPEAGLGDVLFGTKTRTANTLLIVGVGLGTAGVAVVKGHAGAIMGIAGLLTTVGGLYAHFR